MTNRIELPFKISVLIFLKDPKGRFLLLKRNRPPNIGMWSPIGGKLEMSLGESPFECAIRETAEETGFNISEKDLHLFSMISEKNYEGKSHWLMFLFDCQKPIPALPPPIPEGNFSFFTREEIDRLPIPETDRTALWPVHDKHQDGFIALRADCSPGRTLEIITEQIIGNSPGIHPKPDAESA